MATCSGCGNPKPDGRSGYCTDCHSIYMFNYRAARKEGGVPGLSIVDYYRVLAEQNGVCASCGASPKGKRFTRDHNHETNEERQLICNECNLAEGLLKTPERARALADYMERHAVPVT